MDCNIDLEKVAKATVMKDGVSAAICIGESMIEPEVQRECGEHWGENPRLPLHPIGYALLEKNGLLPNQPQKKEFLETK